MMNKHRIGFLILILSLLICNTAGARILFQSTAESGTCNSAVSQSIWDAGQSGNYPNSMMYYRCDTPVPGHTKYFRIDGVNQQHDGFNRSSANITLTSGTTYYYGTFIRYDLVSTSRLWHDTYSELYRDYSADKFMEINGTIRIIMASGFPDWLMNCSNCAGKFTLSAYIDPDHCTTCAVHSSMPHNVSPYGRDNASFKSDYGKWYALVFAITPSHGSATDGRLQTWINGIKVQDYQNVTTQDTTNPIITVFQHNGTWSQPAYDSPPRQVKIDSVTFSDSLTDIQNAGLMSDPAAGSSGNSTPNSPGLLNN